MIQKILRTASLQRRLLLGLIVPLLLIMPAIAMIQYWLIVTPAKLEIDRQLGDDAIAVSGFIHAKGNHVEFSINPQAKSLLLTDQSDREFFLVTDPEGRVLGGDPSLLDPRVQLAAGDWKYVDHQVNGHWLRMLIYGVTCGPGICQVRIGETWVKRHRIKDEALFATAAFSLFFGVMTMVVMILAVQSGLRKISELSEDMARQSPEHLSALDDKKVPSELLPMIHSWNLLLERLQVAHQTQKNFIADVAHQIRTPLTSLQMEVELLLLEPSPPALRGKFENLNRSAHRITHLAAQLLSLARVESNMNSTMRWLPVDLRDVAIRTLEEWSPRALSVGIDLGFELQSAPIVGQQFLLIEGLANVIHNAFLYAGPGCVVTVRSQHSGSECVLSVEDNGPGIPFEERARVCQRFYRGAISSGEGSGLGLAIVSDIVRLHRGQLRIEDAPSGRGVVFILSFPCAESPDASVHHV